MITPVTGKIKQALEEFAILRQLKEHRNSSSKELLQKVGLQFDLTPLEEDFLQRHCEESKEP